jgi:putative tryptophan/tyrosine transport system substrate-binding protein
LGWTDGRNVRIELRWPANDADVTRADATELVALAPDVIVAVGANSLASLLQATRTIPIVFAIIADPVGAGFVESLAHPGGNATGFLTYDYSIATKWLELLKEVAPGVKRVAVLRDPALAGTAQFAAVQAMAPAIGVEATPMGVHDAYGGPIGSPSSPLDHYTRSAGKAPDGLLRALLRERRRAPLLWSKFSRSVSASGWLRR